MGALFFGIGTLGLGTGITVIAALWYLRHVHMPRPPIGVVDGTDIVILLISLCLLPFFYAIIPLWLFILLLFLACTGMLWSGLHPLLRSAYLTWLSIVLISASLFITTWFSNTGGTGGVQLHWIVNDLVIVLVVVAVANLYVQSGMQLYHIAWFVLAYGCYDAIFMWIHPLTALLVTRLTGAMIEPGFGFTQGANVASIGIGDLLAFTLFALIAYKQFRRKGLVTALFLIATCGVLLPTSMAFWLSMHGFQAFFPVQVSFGLAAFLAYLWLSRARRRVAVKTLA